MSSCSPHSISHFIRTRKNGLQSFPPLCPAREDPPQSLQCGPVAHRKTSTLARSGTSVEAAEEFCPFFFFFCADFLKRVVTFYWRDL